jgi:hypothetical protein
MLRTKYYTIPKHRDKYSSLYKCFAVSDEEKKFYNIDARTEYFARTPRYAGLMTSGPLTKKSGVEPGVVDLLGQTLQSYTNDLRYLKSKTDKQVTFENGLKNTAIDTTSVQVISTIARQYIRTKVHKYVSNTVYASACQYISTLV